MNDLSTKPEGLRERKKRETLLRIARTGLKLFAKNGYENTTLDQIAAEAGIARRTFFYYFKSKEAILVAFLDGNFAKAIRPILLGQPDDISPLRATRLSIVELMSEHDPEELLAVIKVLSSTEHLRARMPGTFVEMEQALAEILGEKWPGEAHKMAHRMTAMISIGAMRIGKEAWVREAGRRPLREYLNESFDAVERLA